MSPAAIPSTTIHSRAEGSRRFLPRDGNVVLCCAHGSRPLVPTLITLGMQDFRHNRLERGWNGHTQALQIIRPRLIPGRREFCYRLSGFAALCAPVLDGRWGELSSGGRMDDPLDVDPCIFDLTQKIRCRLTAVPDLLKSRHSQPVGERHFPPAQDQKVTIVGGGTVGMAGQDRRNRRSEHCRSEHAPTEVTLLPRRQIATAAPVRRLAARPHGPRDRGSLKQEDEPLARMQAEIYDPWQ